MKYNNLPTQKLFDLACDLRRYREEYRWNNKIIAKILRRIYAIELSLAELVELEGKLGM